MRRATDTGLIAFEAHVAAGRKIMAHERLHERGGRHTCDKRLGLAAIRAAHPNIDYSLLASEEDPLWGDGVTRESWADVHTQLQILQRLRIVGGCNGIYLAGCSSPSSRSRPPSWRRAPLLIARGRPRR